MTPSVIYIFDVFEQKSSKVKKNVNFVSKKGHGPEANDFKRTTHSFNPAFKIR